MPPTASELISAVSHPLRRQILLAYLEGSVECPTASELAATIDRRASLVAYHLKTLAKGGIVRPAQGGEGRQAEGALYGWALGIDREWLRLMLEVWAESDVSR